MISKLKLILAALFALSACAHGLPRERCMDRINAAFAARNVAAHSNEEIGGEIGKAHPLPVCFRRG